MKITGWTWYDNPEYEEMFPLEKRRECDCWDEIKNVEKLIANELRKCGYKFTGSYHQDGDYGAPIIDDKWVYQCSCRTWGHIMVMAYPEEIDNSDGYGYTLWAWIPPSEMIVPNSQK